MKMSLPLYILLILTIISQHQVLCFQNCVTSSPSVGCLTCITTGNTTLTIAYNISQSKYTCTDITDCISLKSLSTCTQCSSQTILDATNGICVDAPGCAVYNNGVCTSCKSSHVLLNNTCYLKQIQYCTTYIQINGTLGCQSCMYTSMSPTLNCTISPTMCTVFDYSIMKCVQCPSGTSIHSQGIGCYVNNISNCLVYDSANNDICLLCQDNFVTVDNGASCRLASQLFIREQILTYNPVTLSQEYTYKCLNHNQQINTTTLICNITATNHTITNTTCIPGYFFTSTTTPKCQQCSIYISNCALCTNSTTCTTCDAGYYLLSTGTTKKCMPCASYGCLLCSTQFDVNGKVKCLSCPVNTTLYAGSCMSCLNTSFAYSISQSKCVSCNTTIAHCSFCKVTSSSSPNIICIQCQYQYYFDGTTCIQITNTTSVTFDIAKQILKKIAPGSDQALYNNKTGLMSSCNSTDGFICRCNSVSLTSLCYTVRNTVDISQMVFNTSDRIAQYPDQLRMAAQLPTFNLSVNIPDNITDPLTLYQFWNLLSAYSFALIRSSSDTATIIPKIIGHTDSMATVFSDQKITILRGNGFYYKFIPAGLKSGSIGDDDYISTTLSSNNSVVIYAFYSKLLNDTGILSGTTFVSTKNNQSSFNVRFRKTRYSTNTNNQTIKVNSASYNSSNVTLSDGYFTITNFPRSTSNSTKGVAVYGSGSTSDVNIYASQRIENIFYSESWLYILFFLALYLIFIPLCAIVDCCETEQSMRKVNGEDSENKQNESDQTIVKVNYRDFFPLYNVGNTPRPRRLAKVCLFIVNTEHIVTFLTLCYFNLPGGLPIVAIVLMIPAYLCTVIMGYLIGALFRFLPGNFKYLINILTFGYFVLWFFLMRIMTTSVSSQYRLYIVVFSVLSFFLDLVIDGFQTLAVYFSIRQQNQVALFQCLAKWLSLRGYYEFDKLARQLNG